MGLVQICIYEELLGDGRGTGIGINSGSIGPLAYYWCPGKRLLYRDRIEIYCNIVRCAWATMIPAHCTGWWFELMEINTHHQKPS